MRDFSNVKSLRELTADEWIRFRQANPTRYAELETELNGVQKSETPRQLEISVNGYIQNRESIKPQRFINGILQPD